MESRSYINISIGALSLAALIFITAAIGSLHQALQVGLSDYVSQLTLVAVASVLFVLACAMWTHYRLNHMLMRLHASEVRQTLVFDSIRDGIVSANEEGEIVSANPAVERLTGWRTDDLLGEHVSALFSVTTPSARSLQDILVTHGISDGSGVYEIEVVRRNGTRFISEVSMSTVEEEDEDLIHTVVIRDVTENVRARVELEERVRVRTTELQRSNKYLKNEIKRRAKVEAAQQRTVEELQEALAHVKMLSGLLPICAHCKKVRDDKGYWSQIEVYLHEHSDAEFSHGICPDCMDTHFSQYMDKKPSKSPS